MKTITLKVQVDEDQIMGVYQLYLYQLEGRKSKSDFSSYLKSQLIQNGNDEFLLSADMSPYEDLSEKDISTLKKWGYL